MGEWFISVYRLGYGFVDEDDFGIGKLPGLSLSKEFASTKAIISYRRCKADSKSKAMPKG